MSEQAIPQPLSGAEIKDAILYRVREALNQDCFLNDITAYETVQGVIGIRLAMKDCGRDAVVEKRVDVQHGPSVSATDSGVRIEEADIDITAAPPNEVRLDTEQPIPTLVETPEGKREVKRVSYAKPKGARVSPAQQVARARGAVTGEALPSTGEDEPIPAVVEGDEAETL